MSQLSQPHSLSPLPDTPNDPNNPLPKKTKTLSAEPILVVSCSHSLHAYSQRHTASDHVFLLWLKLKTVQVSNRQRKSFSANKFSPHHDHTPSPKFNLFLTHVLFLLPVTRRGSARLGERPILFPQRELRHCWTKCIMRRSCD